MRIHGLIFVVVFCHSIFAAAEDQVLQAIKRHGRADLIVTLKDRADLSPALSIAVRNNRVAFVYDRLRKTALRSQRKLLDLFAEEGFRTQSFHIVNAIAVTDATEAIYRKIKDRADILRIDLNHRFSIKTPNSSTAMPFQIDPRQISKAFLSIGVDRVWNDLGVTGKGIVIAGQDSGYMWNHPALIRQYRGNTLIGKQHDYNWHDAIHSGGTSNCPADSPEPCDDSGHGTHTLGTAVGGDGIDNHIGVAPDAKWIGCRNMNKGVGTVATYLECFEFLLAPYPRGGNPKTDGQPQLAPHIINNSWGCPTSEGCTGHEFIGAIRAVQAAGILVVVALGNDGPSCSTTNEPPGSYSGEVLTVAAYDNQSNDIASFSSRGPSGWNGGIGPTLAAPGNLIRSAVPSGGFSNGLYDYKAGTSMASPHVAGVVALLWSHRPNLIGKIPETIAHLEKTAQAKTSSQSCGKFPGNKIPNAVFGSGLIDAYKALTQ